MQSLGSGVQAGGEQHRLDMRYRVDMEAQARGEGHRPEVRAVREGNRLEVVFAKSSQVKRDWRRWMSPSDNRKVCGRHCRSEMRPSWG